MRKFLLAESLHTHVVPKTKIALKNNTTEIFGRKEMKCFVSITLSGHLCKLPSKSNLFNKRGETNVSNHKA